MNTKITISLVGTLALTVHAAERPNIIYIMTDQQSAIAMSNMGNTDLHTPNMDKLAERGVKFTNAYTTAPLSGPCRSAMFTGLMPSENNLLANGTPLPEHLPQTTLGVLMNEAGYECAYAGKWHVHTGDIPDKKFGFENIHNHNDYGLSESAIEFLNRKHEKPFFLVASYDNPHNICEYARNMVLPFIEIEEPHIEDCPNLPANFAIQPYDAEAIQLERKHTFNTYPTINYTADQWRRYRNAYYRMVEHIDTEIGKLIHAIDEKNLWENTVVIFTSDHGDGHGAHQWNQKSALYEEVMNIPFIVTLPQLKNAGVELPQLINNAVDFYASVCDWANIKLPVGRYGKSFKDIAEKAKSDKKHQDYIVCETKFDKGTGTLGWMVRTEKYKYVLYSKGQYREQLYDMNNDRMEMRNLCIERKYDAIVEEHRAILNEWMKRHKVKGARVGLGHVPK